LPLYSKLRSLTCTSLFSLSVLTITRSSVFINPNFIFRFSGDAFALHTDQRRGQGLCFQADGVPRRAQTVEGQRGGAAGGGDPLVNVQRGGASLAFGCCWPVDARAAGALARRGGRAPDPETPEDSPGRVAPFPA